MDIPLDEVIYVEAISSSSTGAAADADSTPTFAVYEEATDTDIGVGGNMTKRTSLTGDYRASFTASAANGFELGKWYSVIGSATIGAIATKGVLARFRVIAAEVVAGYPPADTLKVGGTTQTARDIGASVLLSNGTGTGQVKIASGYLAMTWADIAAPTTTVNLSGTTIKTATDIATQISALNNLSQSQVTGGAYALSTDANGRIRIVDGTGTGELDTNSGKVFLSGTQTFDNTGSWTGNITGNLSGSVGSVSGAVGSVTGAVGSVTGNVGGNVTGSVGSVTAAITLPTIPADWITASGIAANAIGASELATDAVTEIAGGVWDLATSGHTTSGTFGAAMNAAGSAGDPWATSVPGAYGAGTAGFILGTNLNATVSSRSTLTQSQVTGGAYALDTDANGRVRIVDGTAAGELDTNAGKVLLATTQAFNNTGSWTGDITGNLSGSVGSVTGAVGSVTGTVGSVTGNVGGNVTGSVGSVATGGIVAASIATAAAEKLADITLRRTPTNIEASSFGDTLALGSLYGLIQQAQKSDTTTHAGKLTVFKVNGVTELGQLTITTDAAAEPITSAL